MSKDNATPPPTVASSDMPSKEEMEAISVMKDEELEWLFETPKQGSKFFTKAKENPFVPIGCAATVAALSYGLLQFHRGNVERSQLAMRLRVVAQGSTVVALVLGAFMTGKSGWRKKATSAEPSQQTASAAKVAEQGSKTAQVKEQPAAASRNNK